MASYLVTGCSHARGLGLQFADQLSSNPANTVFALVRTLSNSQALQSLASTRKNLHIIEADINEISALKAARSSVENVLGSGKALDHLILNAAYLQSRDSQSKAMTQFVGNEEELEFEFMKSFRTNVVSVVNSINIFLPLLRRSSIKKILVISSGRGDLELNLLCKDPTAAPYCVSKGAVNFVVAKYNIELKSEGFTVFAVSPGIVSTDANAIVTEEEQKAWDMMTSAFKSIMPQWDGSVLEPKDSARMVLAVLERAGEKEAGRMVSHHGTTQWL